MKVTGSCHCGEIEYEATIETDGVGICHCTDCQTLSGSAFRTVALTVPGEFKLKKGELKKYVKIGDSGNERTQSFCPNCGSPICSSPVTEGKIQYSIRVGTIKELSELIPTFQIWCQSAQSWLRKHASIDMKESNKLMCKST